MFCRLLSNFERCEGKLVAVGDIVAEGKRIKETFSVRQVLVRWAV